MATLVGGVVDLTLDALSLWVDSDRRFVRLPLIVHLLDKADAYSIRSYIGLIIEVRTKHNAVCHVDTDKT